MINIELLRKEPQKVKNGIAKKRHNPELVDAFLEIDKKWRELVSAIDATRAEKKLLKQGDAEKGKELKEKVKAFEDQITVLEKERDAIIEQIPNLPAEDVPVGKDDAENIVLREVGKKPEFSFKPKDYLELCGDWINTESATRVAGSRFGYIMGDLVLLEFALVKLAMDKLLPHGFTPVVPPVMARPEVMKDMGKAKFIGGDDAFYLPKDDLYLVGSSEHTIGPLNMGKTLDVSKPIRYMGFSTCFRREAGSYGKDTKGILRVHQFDKVEMFSISRPEDSEKEHQFLLAREEELMQALGLPYRVMAICTGDMGFDTQRQYDVETWLPGQGKYRETQSCSNTSDFQSRGLSIKYKDSKTQKADYVHMLNATAFAIGRMLIAIVENNQKEDGTIVVPEALRAYVGKTELKAPKLA